MFYTKCRKSGYRNAKNSLLNVLQDAREGEVDLDLSVASSVQPHYFSSYTGDMSYADDTMSDISTYTYTHM